MGPQDLCPSSWLRYAAGYAHRHAQEAARRRPRQIGTAMQRSMVTRGIPPAARARLLMRRSLRPAPTPPVACSPGSLYGPSLPFLLSSPRPLLAPAPSLPPPRPAPYTHPLRRLRSSPPALPFPPLPRPAPTPPLPSIPPTRSGPSRSSWQSTSSRSTHQLNVSDSWGCRVRRARETV